MKSLSEPVKRNCVEVIGSFFVDLDRCSFSVSFPPCYVWKDTGEPLLPSEIRAHKGYSNKYDYVGELTWLVLKKLYSTHRTSEDFVRTVLNPRSWHSFLEDCCLDTNLTGCDYGYYSVVTHEGKDPCLLSQEAGIALEGNEGLVKQWVENSGLFDQPDFNKIDSKLRQELVFNVVGPTLQKKLKEKLKN